VKDEPWADEILVIHGGADKKTALASRTSSITPVLIALRDRRSQRGIGPPAAATSAVNYELPWNPEPSRTAHRSPPPLRPGEEVTVWNFSFEDTRESKVFEMLQDKVESIRGQLGNTADVLGMLDGINVGLALMESIRTTNRRVRRKKSWKNLIDERQRTLAEWQYERSLIDNDVR